jgi:hypothetical protein
MPTVCTLLVPMKSNNNNNDDDDDDNTNNTAMGSVHVRGDTFLTFGLKALTETNTSRLATGSYPFSTSALDGVEWSASRPGRALVPREGPPVPIIQEAGWVSELVWTQRL